MLRPHNPRHRALVLGGAGGGQGALDADTDLEDHEMSDTPRTDAAIIAANGRWTYELKEEMQAMERELNAANERIKRLEEVAAKLANCARFLGTWNHDSMDVLRMKDEAMDELQNLEKEKP